MQIFPLVSYLSSQYPYVAFFTSAGSMTDQYGEYEWILGFADSSATLLTQWSSLEKIQGEWLTGILPYELKNVFEPTLNSNHNPEIEFPEVAFFVPQCLVYLKKKATRIHVAKGKEIWNTIKKKEKLPVNPGTSPAFESAFSPVQYTETIEKLKNHILEGDFYEINLTQRFGADYSTDSPFDIFRKLITVSPVPFGAYIRWDQKHLICASPERFLKLKKEKIISQPIKGTIRRGKDAQEDALLKETLRLSEKERAENIMIVDLMRNDLYRSSEINSVKVPLLWEVQTFPQVHQLVSTITGKKRKAVSPAAIIRNTFPPGSMTGAPKVKSMEMIDRYEPVSRGVYAGSAGYFTPSGDFDLNVIIRSLIYDNDKKRLSYHVGGAITYDSVPLNEYEESLLKAAAIRKIWEEE
ncbi:MAG: anthranilate synthase component I family protein [Bacteroidia bacterium]|nr:anthranilate synthase component I family protein [Bacteroidia bacterium]